MNFLFPLLFIGSLSLSEGRVLYISPLLIGKNPSPSLECLYQKGPIRGVKNCTLPEEKDASEWNLACYHLVREDTVTQDCWIHQQIDAMDQCHDSCVSGDSEMHIRFCCCSTPKCNAEILLQHL